MSAKVVVNPQVMTTRCQEQGVGYLGGRLSQRGIGYPMMHVMYLPIYRQTDRQTNTRENITFRQLRLRAVISKYWMLSTLIKRTITTCSSIDSNPSDPSSLVICMPPLKALAVCILDTVCAVIASCTF